MQVLADCVVVTLLVAFALSLSSGGTPLDDLGPTLAEVWIYVILIATPAHWALPHLYPLMANRGPAAKWSVFAAVLAAISVAGSIAGGVIVFVLSLEPGVTLHALLAYSVKLSIFLALLVGVVHAVVILLQDRLHAAETSLHEQKIKYEQVLKLASEARLAALEARIHPHFLFNALNTVASLIPTAPVQAEGLIQRLSALLRFSLDANQQRLVALHREIKIARDYLEIEQARFGPRLRFAIDMNGDLADRQVPPLAVQTLVENSVKYAVGPARDGAEIRVRALADGDGVRVEVADTGPGFSAADLPAGHGLDTL
ncbi:MAG TPA: histidine kinase, partial [Gammaproteobacteria bacterium]|nr:histidine kinase [Gammaproteobacteria bacterium]